MIIILATPIVIVFALCCFSILGYYAKWHQEDAWCKVLEQEENIMPIKSQVFALANQVFNRRFEVFAEDKNGQLTFAF